MINRAIEWILNCPDYPTLRQFREEFGWDDGCSLIDTLTETNQIFIDPDDNTILYMGVNNNKLKRLITEGVMIR